MDIAFGSSEAGKLGGAARAKSLSKERRSEIASLANAVWMERRREELEAEASRFTALSLEATIITTRREVNTSLARLRRLKALRAFVEQKPQKKPRVRKTANAGA